MARKKLSETLRDEAGDAWRAITEDPFTDALAAGTLPRERMVTYLVQDHRFVDAFSVLLCSMLSKVTLQDRIFGSQFLAAILSEENTYFERSFVALKATPEERSAPTAAATAAFAELMRSSQTKLHTTLAVLVVCEWSYLDWGERVAPKADLPFFFAEWITLHSGPDFRNVVSYLRNLLDGLDLSPADLDETRAAFHRAVKCEKDFWDMVNNEQQT
eukprot:CAMPEP_0118896650 /NCGR_PEP_ID=MMETSP1166-20130328/4415_1 /TAXON_ID=1104430 /ORGANISM="Chrysoreinhardia sp, Strain CCMP3193" /LENGTH=215 /DNA_ID=CAMNT_0006835709 /DNA_START=15 /DNA_END=662 /DNA_ORIENTATION=+